MHIYPWVLLINVFGVFGVESLHLVMACVTVFVCVLSCNWMFHFIALVNWQRLGIQCLFTGVTVITHPRDDSVIGNYFRIIDWTCRYQTPLYQVLNMDLKFLRLLGCTDQVLILLVAAKMRIYFFVYDNGSTNLFLPTAPNSSVLSATVVNHTLKDMKTPVKLRFRVSVSIAKYSHISEMCDWIHPSTKK